MVVIPCRCPGQQDAPLQMLNARPALPLFSRGFSTSFIWHQPPRRSTEHNAKLCLITSAKSVPILVTREEFENLLVCLRFDRSSFKLHFANEEEKLILRLKVLGHEFWGEMFQCQMPKKVPVLHFCCLTRSVNHFQRSVFPIVSYVFLLLISLIILSTTIHFLQSNWSNLTKRPKNTPEAYKRLFFWESNSISLLSNCFIYSFIYLLLLKLVLTFTATFKPANCMSKFRVLPTTSKRRVKWLCFDS